MNSSCLRFAVALVLVLTQKVAFACVEDGTCEGTNPSKVVTSFLKVPWMNVNSSWREEVGSQCRNDVTTLFESADAGEMWALQMLDSTSRIPSGILTGNIVDLGQYDECIGTKGQHNPANITGQHCMISFSIPSKFVKDVSAMLYIQKLSMYNPTADVDPSLTLSACLPSSCSNQDVVGFVNTSIQRTPEFSGFKVSVARVTCSGVESTNDLTMGTILTICFFVVIASVLLFCTVCDFVVRSGSKNASLTMKTLAKFSTYTNAIKLLSTEEAPGTMPAICGIRFLNTILVVILHRGLVTGLNPAVNLSDLNQFKQSVMSSLMLTLPYTVDTFFLISGFLATHSFQKQLRSGTKFNVLGFYFHRYVRLAPCVAFLLLFIIFVIPYYESGPLWQTVIGDEVNNCGRNWWTYLLFVQNIVNRQEMCIPHIWYSAVDMQFFVLCPIILYPLFRRPKLGLAMLGILLIASFITPAVQIIVYSYTALFNSNKIHTECLIDFFNSYTMTYNRALPYLIGILLGYDVMNNKRRVTKVQAAFNWTLTCVFVLFCVWNTFFIVPNVVDYDMTAEATYVSFGRLAWSLAMAWILYACTQGYGGPVTRFLSLPIFTPLSRMSYNIYLVHFLIQVLFTALKRTSDFYTPYAMIHLVSGDLVMSIALAFLMYVCIESPTITLVEILRAQLPTASNINRVSTMKKAELSAMIGDYFDVTKSQVDSDSAVEMRMPQKDYWQVASHVLNTLSNRPTKTPADWQKIWQEWTRDSRRASRAKDIQTEADQSQTSVPTLEHEFLTFLIAVSYDVDDVANSEELDTAELARPCHLSSRDSPSKDLVPSLTSDLITFVKKRINRRES